MLLEQLAVKEVIKFSLAGGIGALVKDILKDNVLRLPCRINNKLVLGSLGGIIVGAFIGCVVDKSFTTALMGGFMGYSVIESLLKNYEPSKKNS